LPKGDFVVVKDEFGFGVPSSLLQHPQVKRIANHIIQCGLHSFCSQQCKIEAHEKYPFLFSEESKESQLALETLCNNTMGKAPLLIARIIGLLQSNTISSDDSLVEGSVPERNHIWQLLQTLYCPSLEDNDENEPKDKEGDSPLMGSNDIVQEYALMRKLFPSTACIFDNETSSIFVDLLSISWKPLNQTELHWIQFLLKNSIGVYA